MSQEGGATATIAIFYRTSLVVAWVGDSSAIMGVHTGIETPRDSAKPMDAQAKTAEAKDQTTENSSLLQIVPLLLSEDHNVSYMNKIDSSEEKKRLDQCEVV